LRNQQEDGTFNQGNLAVKVREALIKGQPVFGYDLSQATDRFPITFQREVLVIVLGLEKADQWVELVSKREFTYNGKGYYYGRGQPMGLLSS
jgi:hypothetical protein